MIDNNKQKRKTIDETAKTSRTNGRKNSQCRGKA